MGENINEPNLKDPKADAYDRAVYAYRNNFIASQSFMLAVGAMLLDKGTYLVLLVAGLALISIWYIWYRVITARKRLADFFAYRLGDTFNITSEQYLKVRKMRLDVYKKMTNKWNRYKRSGEKENFRTNRLTRFKLDILIPIIMSLVWVGFVLYQFKVI